VKVEELRGKARRAIEGPERRGRPRVRSNPQQRHSIRRARAAARERGTGD
ncbi:unnamed protein product, partial [marine sediment metagenome]